MTLVFGGQGFVAQNLRYETKISRQDCDLAKYDQILSILKHFKPKSVINCAAAHGSAKFMSSNHVNFLQNNLVMDSNLLRACHELNIENVVLMSSVSAFPSIADKDLTESDLYTGGVNDYNFGYNTSKRISHELCKSYALDYGRNYKTLFLGNLYGKFGKFALDSSVLNSVIFQMGQAKLNNADLQLYGTGEDERAFTYVEDLNSVIDTFIDHKEINSAIFSSDEVYTIKEVAKIVAEIMCFEGEITFTGEGNSGQKRKVASSRYLQSKVPGLIFTRFDVGLNQVITWYVNSFPRTI